VYVAGGVNNEQAALTLFDGVNLVLVVPVDHPIP
jgi:hypothetical protein